MRLKKFFLIKSINEIVSFDFKWLIILKINTFLFMSFLLKILKKILIINITKLININKTRFKMRKIARNKQIVEETDNPMIMIYIKCSIIENCEIFSFFLRKLNWNIVSPGKISIIK